MVDYAQGSLTIFGPEFGQEMPHKSQISLHENIYNYNRGTP